jgi:7-cyano-7-deazaguanine synthase
MDRRFVVETPLMWLDKAQTWALSESLGGKELVEMLRVETHSCYRGAREDMHVWGMGCGTCPACDLRRRGWKTYVELRSQGNLLHAAR